MCQTLPISVVQFFDLEFLFRCYGCCHRRHHHRRRRSHRVRMTQYIHSASPKRIQIAKKGGNSPSKFIKKKKLTKTFNHGHILNTLIHWHGAVCSLFISLFYELALGY